MPSTRSGDLQTFPSLRVLLRLRRPLRTIMPRAFPATSLLIIEALRPISNAINLILATMRNHIVMKYRSSRNPCLAGKRKQQYLRSPPYSKQVLHFGWQSAKSNCRFNADANTGHGFAIFMASVGALRASRSGAG